MSSTCFEPYKTAYNVCM